MEKLRPRAPKIIYIFSGILILLLFLPTIVMALNSLLENSQWTLKWYLEVFDDSELLQALGRSLMIGILSALLSVVLGLLTTLTIYKSTFRLKKWLNHFSNLSLSLPELVLSLSLLTWFYVLKFELGFWTVVIAHITLILPYAILTLNSRLAGLDVSCEEAAKDLGATDIKVLLSVTLPLMIPGIISAFALSFLLSFDDFLVTFYTSGAGSDTLPIKLYAGMRFGLSPKLSALSTIMFLFTLGVILSLFRRKSKLL